MEYKTKAKENLIRYLKENSNYSLSVGEILSNVEGMTKSTLYRNLNELVENKTVHKYFNEVTNSYEYSYNDTENCFTHLHVKCSVCGKIYHLQSNINQIIAKSEKIKIDYENSLLNGVCSNCLLFKR